MSTELVATILAQMDTLAQVHTAHPRRAERLQEARSASFKQRLDALAGALTDNDAVLLSDAAELALGPHAQLVLDAIDNAIAFAPPDEIFRATSGKCQTLVNFPGFLTVGQWARLTTSGNIATWMQAVSECAQQIGCV
jgi:hypothetical protein